MTCWGTSATVTDNMPSDSLKFATTSSGLNHSCGLDTDGLLHCWGNSAFTPFGSYYPSVSSVSVGRTHVCAEDLLGGLQCWKHYGEVWPHTP